VEPVRLTLDGVAKRYAETVALREVSVTVEDGEFFTFVGPSGCGKTTTLRLVAGFEKPSAGAIRFDGEDVAGVPPEDRDVGVVFQNYALFPHMTVGENVAYGLRFADPPGGVSRRERVADLLELVDLEGMEDRDPDALSGGQQQRVALARALAPGPRLLLLDEPMSALDAQLRERLRMQVREIQSELDITTLYVTHDQEEALAISDRVAVMRRGAIEQVGPPRTVYRRPESRFVAEFLGDNNVFEGRIRDVEMLDAGDETEGCGSGSAAEHTARAIARVRVDDTTVRLTVDPELAASGDRIEFCVRPERLRVGSGTNRLTAAVRSAEFLGDATRVHLDWQGRSLTLRTDEPPTGTVDLGFDPSDAHVLAPGASGSNVIPRTEPSERG
jgi:thiamine transport system ATP-binding protein